MSAKDIANFKHVETQRSNNPDRSVREILTSTKISPASYYRGRKLALGAPAKRRNAAVAASTAADKTKGPRKAQAVAGRMYLLVGTPEQMREALGQV